MDTFALHHERKGSRGVDEVDEGVAPAEAAILAARLRFRAVLMTAFSFILGVIPLLVAEGAGSASRRTMGTTVFGGMLAATVISLLMVPVLYTVVQRTSEFGGGKKKTADGDATPGPSAS